MCMIEEELAFARSVLQQALEFLPENVLVGLVSCGTRVQVHELGYVDMSMVYVFRGSKEMTKDQVLDQLGLGSGAGGGFPAQGFLDLWCLLLKLLEELETDQWPVAQGNRSLWCTRVALSVAAGLLGACMLGIVARIVALVGGPCTEDDFFAFNVVARDREFSNRYTYRV